MEINKIVKNDDITLQLDGWLDTESSPLLNQEIEKIDSASSITLDFEDIEYIASSGLRQVVACYKKAKSLNADFKVINVGTEAMSIFQLTKLDQKINVIPKQ